MTEAINTQNLIKCLQEKQRFKGTTIYLHEANQFNQKVYDIFNEALLAVLIKKHQNYMAKLLGLRLFRDLVVSGNFTLIDSLDEKIEEEIIKIAQYNKKSKEINRGANYFIQMENLKTDPETQKLGASYVLLATQIIIALAKWCPVNEDGEETRFVEYYRELSGIGVTFPKDNQLTFFKKEEEEKFKKNYGKWMKWYIQKVKEEDDEGTLKQITQKKAPINQPNQKVGSSKPAGTVEQPKQQKIPIKEQNIKESHLKLTDSKIKIQSNAQESKMKSLEVKESKLSNIEAKQSRVEQIKPKVPNALNVDTKEPRITINESKTVPIGDQKKELENKLSLLNIEKNQLALKYQTQLTKIKNSNQLFQNQLIDAKKSLSMSESQKESLQKENQLKKSQLQKIMRYSKQLEEKVSDLTKKVTKSIPTALIESECYQIKVSPPQENEDLQEQNQALMEALQTTEQSYKQKKKQFQEEILLMKQKNKQLSQTILIQSKQLQQLKNKKTLQQQIVQNIIRQDSLIIHNEPRLQCKVQPLTSTLNQPVKVQCKRIGSVSEYLKASSKNVVQNHLSGAENRLKSLKKTQSQHKMSTLKKHHQTFSNIGLHFQGKPSANYNKTTQHFYKNPQEQCTSLVTYYPQLEGYFQPLPSECVKFKQHCLKLERGRFYQNELISVSIQKTSYSIYTVSIFNKSKIELKMKILSGHYSIVIEGQKNRRVSGLNSIQLQIKADNIDLNLRFPIISIIIGNQRISLSNSTPNDRTLHIPLPITLMDFKKVYPDQERDWLGNKKIAKYCSNQVSLSKCHSSIQACFPEFKLTHGKNGMISRAGMELNGFGNAKVLIEIEETQCDACIGVLFASQNQNSASLAKVIMQVLLYLIQK